MSSKYRYTRYRTLVRPTASEKGIILTAAWLTASHMVINSRVLCSRRRRWRTDDLYRRRARCCTTRTLPPRIFTFDRRTVSYLYKLTRARHRSVHTFAALRSHRANVVPFAHLFIYLFTAVRKVKICSKKSFFIGKTADLFLFIDFWSFVSPMSS